MKREARIGIFMGIISVLLIVFIFVVGDIGNLFRKKGYFLSASFETTAGLEKRAVVRMAGVKIGYVYDIVLQGSVAEAVMHIEHDVKIKKDSTASLALLSLLGERYVEILPGTMEEFCQPGESIQGINAQSFGDIGSVLINVGQDLQDTSRMLKNLIGEEESPGAALKTIQDVEVFVENLNELLKENRESVRETIHSSSEAIRAFDARVGEVADNVNELAVAMKEVVEKSHEDFDSQMMRVKEILTDLETALELLTESLDRINKGEGSLGRLINESGLYENAEEAVTTLQKTAQPLSRMKAEIGVSAEYYSQSSLLKSQFSLFLKPSSDKVVLARIIQDPWEDRFTLTLQGGLRWKNISARVGIIESAFGAGVDYYFFDDRIRMSLEGYDFNRDSQPHFRLKAEVLLVPSLFFIMGIDDFALEPNREVFFGLGFSL